MKVTVIANISANGKVLLSDHPHHQLPPEAMEFYLAFAKKMGNLVIGFKTFENFLTFPQEVKDHFSGIEIVILSENLTYQKITKLLEVLKKLLNICQKKAGTKWQLAAEQVLLMPL
jgi:hypothetical protein